MSNDSMFKRIVKAAIGDNAVVVDSVAEKLHAVVGDNAFVNMVAGLGTVRDKASYGEYQPVKRKGVAELSNTYHQDWIARRIINKPAYDAIRSGWYFGKVDTEKNQAIINECKDLKLNKVLLKALALSRLHGWSYILVGVNDDTDLSEPLDMYEGGLGFFTVLKREQLKPKKDGENVSANITKGRYNEPEIYQMGSDYEPRYVHYTRVIKIEAPDPVGGDDDLPMPILQHVYETLIRYASVSANAGSLVYESKIDIIRVPNLMKNLMANPGGTINSLITRFASIATLKGNNGVVVLDKDEEYESKSYSFGGLPELMREFAVQTAGAAEMPYSLLFGQSPSGMNSSGDFDMQSYYDSVNTMQENVLKEPIEVIIDLIAQSLGYSLGDIGLIFNSLWQVDEKTKSDIEVNNANRDKINLELGLITEAHAAQQLVDDGTYTTIDAEHIEMLKGMGGQAYELRT